jgi:hypothetical protein
MRKGRPITRGSESLRFLDGEPCDRRDAAEPIAS